MLSADHTANLRAALPKRFLEVGAIVEGKYEVVGHIRSGGQAQVYLVRHVDFPDRLMAMKASFLSGTNDPDVVAARFQKEVMASYQVTHPNVVRVFDYICDGDLLAYTMEYIVGGDLADRVVGREPMQIPEILSILCDTCAGLQAIHHAGVIHRDIKPENILLGERGEVKISDFGIARLGMTLSKAGGIVGTIDYLSPEYLKDGNLDIRSDLYSLGIVAYEMVTGMTPFRGSSLIQTLDLRLNHAAEHPRRKNPDCPEALARIILRALQHDPALRYQSASELRQDLERVRSAAPARTVGATLGSGTYRVAGRSIPTIEQGLRQLNADSSGSLSTSAEKHIRVSVRSQRRPSWSPMLVAIGAALGYGLGRFAVPFLFDGSAVAQRGGPVAPAAPRHAETAPMKAPRPGPKDDSVLVVPSFVTAPTRLLADLYTELARLEQGDDRGGASPAKDSGPAVIETAAVRPVQTKGLQPKPGVSSQNDEARAQREIRNDAKPATLKPAAPRPAAPRPAEPQPAEPQPATLKPAAAQPTRSAGRLGVTARSGDAMNAERAVSETGVRKMTPKSSQAEAESGALAGLVAGWYVEADVVRSAEQAEAQVTALQKAGFSARLQQARASRAVVYRVLAGPAASEAQASALRESLSASSLASDRAPLREMR